jgi:DNA mismatch repair protein MutS
MRQYLEVKARHPDAILFFRLGDFYEMFYEDAVYVAGALSLTLTSRDKGKEDAVPMCGVPYHAARGYIAKLTELGRRVAICEQLEDPKTVRGIVKRDVVRIVTPGVILDEESLDPRAPNFVAAVRGDARSGYGLAFLEVTTGDFRATEAASAESLLDELARVEARELVVDKADSALAALLRRAYPRVTLSPVAWPGEEARTVLREALGPGFPASEAFPLALEAAAGVFSYAKTTQPASPLPLVRLELFRREDTLVLDEQARAHLELTESLLERRRQGSLVALLDVTRSAMGGRLLRRWLLFPLRDVAAIRRRQDAVERLVEAHGARDELRRVLAELNDIERLVGRAKLGVATPRDLVVLGASLARLPAAAEALRQAAAGDLVAATEAATAGGDGVRAGTSGSGASGSGEATLGSDLASDVAARLQSTLRDDAPALTKDGGFIAPGVSAELDELVAIAAGGRDTINQIEARERQRTGIASLKIKHNSVFGYYIEITRAQLERVPADYIRKQTVANAERFVTPELSDYEAKIATADERRVALENALFVELRQEVAREAPRLLALAGRVAAVDVLAALAETAHRHGYCRPHVDDSTCLVIEEGRHPVVERLAAAGGFVPNDLTLDPEREQVLIVTGPNMAGKSTLIRQTALIVILAQMGAFVPAKAARVGICDRVFTRVGAGDNLARGESTFLVEMRETAHILRYATARSLVVLDEIGRGTSTYDGVSIAWSVAEHLHDHVGAKTLFATHYHELCALAERCARVRNVSVAAREWNGDVVFLRKLMPGGASRSFGIEVAKLAGMPASVVGRARAILQGLEGGAPQPGQPTQVHPLESGNPAPQLGLFGWSGHAGAAQSSPRREDPRAAAPVEAPDASDASAQSHEVLRTLSETDPDDLSPRAAWQLLADLRKKLTLPPSR